MIWSGYRINRPIRINLINIKIFTNITNLFLKYGIL